MSNKPLSLKHFVLFFLISAIHLFSLLLPEGPAFVESVSKVLLLPSLIVVFFRLTKGRVDHRRWFVLAALLLSWVGDVALLFQGRSNDYFLLGLMSFLFAHICYVIAFNLSLSVLRGSLLWRRPWLIPIFFGYGIFMFLLMSSGLGAMLVPVLLYMSVILVMGLSALNRYGTAAAQSFWPVMLGALLFILSDSFLALNKFREPFSSSSLLIMFSYILAQFFIVLGMTEEERSRA
jgi:uncharacterized membrane protein YhhN